MSQRDKESGRLDNLAKKLSENPFYGIDHFETIDQETVLSVENGGVGHPGWARYEYYPRVGYIRVIKRKGDSSTKRDLEVWNYNLRTKFGWGPSGSMRDKDHVVIRSAIDILKDKFSLIKAGGGYPEVEGLVREVTGQVPIPTSDLIVGNYYLTHDNRGVYVYQYDHQHTGQMIIGEEGTSIFSRKNDLLGDNFFLEISVSGEPKKPLTTKNIVTTVINPRKKHNQEYNSKTKHYLLTSQQAEQVGRLRPVEEDPYIGTNLTREGVTIYSAIQGMQYERWGKDEVDRGSRYANINSDNYGKALKLLILRFGANKFAIEVESIFEEHLNGLHTNLHLSGSPYKPHSDVYPLGADLMALGSQAIFQAHPLPHSMAESGHVVNAKTLFGDADFWRIMRTEYPKLFNRFVDFMIELPRNYLQHGTYSNAVVDPVALVKQYFPDAFREIVVSRPDFDSNTPEAIIIKG